MNHPKSMFQLSGVTIYGFIPVTLRKGQRSNLSEDSRFSRPGVTKMQSLSPRSLICNGGRRPLLELSSICRSSFLQMLDYSSVLRYGPHWICFEGGGSLIRGLSYARRLTNSNQGGHSSRPRRGEHPLAEDAGLQTLVP